MILNTEVSYTTVSACSGGSPTGSPTTSGPTSSPTTGNCAGVATWSSSSVYTGGQQVTYG